MHFKRACFLFVIIFILSSIILIGCTSSSSNDPAVTEDATVTSSASVEASLENTATTDNTASDDPRLESLKSYIDKYIKDTYFSGTVLVAEKGKILFTKGFGYADAGAKIENTQDTVFRLASNSKQFTAMGILILEERGLLSTDDTLDKYIKDYPNGDKITIHNLLTHTSGIAEHTNGQLFSDADHYYSPEDLIALFKDKPLQFKPGTRFSYCNSNYILLGYIISKVSGQSYEDFIKENVFDKLGMTASGYDHNGTDGKLTAIGYQDSKVYREAGYLDMSIPYAAGGLVSTVMDLNKWDKALYTEELISKETREKMFTPFLQNYAYGWGVSTQTIDGVKYKITEHSGGIHGFTTHILRNIDNESVVIVLSNKENQELGSFAHRMNRLLCTNIK